MDDEPKDIYSKVKSRKCDRAYAFAKDLEARCDQCDEKVGDHQTPFSLRGVEKMLDGEFNHGVETAAKHIKAHSCVSSCCDAQPAGGDAAELAECVRKLTRL